MKNAKFIGEAIYYQWECPDCGEITDAAEEPDGQEIQCPKCKNWFYFTAEGEE